MFPAEQKSPRQHEPAGNRSGVAEASQHRVNERRRVWCAEHRSRHWVKLLEK